MEAKASAGPAALEGELLVRSGRESVALKQTEVSQAI